MINDVSRNTPIMGDGVDGKDSLSVIDQDLDELDSLISSLNKSVAYAMKRKDDLGWKFWKWPETINAISKTLYEIHVNANKCEKIISRLKKHVSQLKKLDKTHSKLFSEDNPYINNVNNGFCQDDAQYMATRLSETLNTTFSVHNVSASELHEGDIIQYLSEGKYPRYLKVQKIESSNNNTQKLLGITPIDVSTGYLECTGDKIVAVPLIGNVICLTQPNGMNVYDTLNNAVGIQQNSIDTTRKEGEKLEKKAEKIDKSMDALIKLNKVVRTFILGGVVVAFCTLFITPPAIVAESITVIFVVLTFTIGFILLELNSMYKDLNVESYGLIHAANSCETDLNTYTATSDKTNITMNVTTFNGIPIIKQPPISDWKNFTFIRMMDPSHGDLLPGPGLQFLYGPTEGYTGSDTFKFQYIDQYNRIIGNITVNILISPIPVFNRTPRGVVS